MNCEQAAHDLGRPAARHAAFRRDAEVGHVLRGGLDAFPGGFDAISMNQAQEQIRTRRELQFAQRLEVSVVRAVHRNR